MKQVFAFSFLTALVIFAGGCGSSNPTVATIGNDKISLEDFESSYSKNNGGWSNAVTSSMKDRERFLDLLVKFRLKVRDAKNEGFLEDSSVIEELNSYRLSVAQSFMLEKELITPGVQQMYRRMLEEIHAAHILIRLPENPTSSDTLKAFEKAQMVISLIPKLGFDSVARTYSEDALTAPAGGDVGWVGPGRVFPEFEDAVYALREGEYSRIPVRTQFGYHIIKLLKRQPASGAIRVSHILKRFSADMKDSAAVRDTVWQLYSKLRRGADFAEMARKYSDDPGSSQRGGDIGYYERQRLRPDIVNLLFDLRGDSIPPPYKQPYGYHIFKVTGHRSVAPFAEMEKDLRTEYQQRYYPRDLAEYVKRLKIQYRLAVNVPVQEQLRVAFDSTKTPADSTWRSTITQELLGKALLTCAGKDFTVKAFLDSVDTMQEFRGSVLTPPSIDAMIARIADAEALKEHASRAPERYPELKALMDEYLDGILLYRIEQEEVWKRVVVNDSLLRAFYDSTKDHYRWPPRVNFAEVFVTNDSVKNVVERRLAQGQDFLAVAEEFTARAGYRDKLGIWGYQPYGLNELTQKAALLPDESVSDFFRDQNGWSMIKVLGKDSARTKSFEEAGPELASAYQEQASKVREAQWIETLKQKYGVTLHVELLEQAFKRKPIETK